MEFEDFEDNDSMRSEKAAYTVLTEEDMKGRLDEDITKICSTIDVPRGAARILLTKFKWNVDVVTDKWFDDEQQVRNNVGLLQEFCEPITDQASQCLICLCDFTLCDMKSASCGHLFCKQCYKLYIESKIDDGHGCINIKCPQSPECVAAVTDDMIETLVSSECRKRLRFYVVRSYIETKKNIKWCPAQGCDYAIEFELGSDDYDVKCACSYMFCWNCASENHRPVNCETVKEWSLMNNDKSNDSLWILAYTKPCPKCKKPIEKNSGCLHMTCPTPCNHHFCWLCLRDWKEHEYNVCNRYNEQSRTDTDETKQEAKKHLQRYGHYYERWQLNQYSREKARENLKKWESKALGKVIDMCGQTKLELQFVTDAWQQIIECRRVLKWTYAYGYYMNSKEKTKQKFFESLQGEAEAALERLHHCAEKDLVDYVDAGGKDHAIKLKIIRLTGTTSKFFKNLVTALENGLKDVAGSSDHYAYGGSSSTIYDDAYEYDLHYHIEQGWDCAYCTYYNFNHDAQDCHICLLPRPRPRAE